MATYKLEDVIDTGKKTYSLDEIVGKKESSGMARRAAYGAFEPIDAMAQMLYNSLPEGVRQAGDDLNNWLAARGLPLLEIPSEGFNRQLSNIQQEYQATKPETDVARTAGNIATGVVATRKIPMGTSLKSMAAGGAGAGAILGPLQPVYDYDTAENDFWSEKAKQSGMGAGMGIAMAPAGYALSRAVSPKASLNPDVKAMKDVKPTVGQTLGGWINRTEEKLQSMGIMGDAIMAARQGARDRFNVSYINKALFPIGKKVKEAGWDGIGQAKRLISKAYDDVFEKIGGFNLDRQAVGEMNNMRSLSANMSKDLRNAFDDVMSKVDGMISPAQGMKARTFKEVDNLLRTEAQRYSKSSVMIEQNLGKAFGEIRNSLHQALNRADPEGYAALRRVDHAFANLESVKAGAKSSVLSEGIMTPGQALGGIRQADQSARKTAFVTGNAGELQDYARSAQNVLGNKYPESGTAGRALANVAALGMGNIEPMVPLGLVTGALAYTQPAQTALRALVSSRPDLAPYAAQLIRQSTPGAGIPLTGLLYSGN